MWLKLAALGAIGTSALLGPLGVHHASATSGTVSPGQVCVYPNKGETGTQYCVTIPATAKAGSCYQINGIPDHTTIQSADNELTVTIKLGTGKCPNSKPDPKDAVPANTKEDLPDSIIEDLLAPIDVML